jgi:hypothetical protein
MIHSLWWHRDPLMLLWILRSSSHYCNKNQRTTEVSGVTAQPLLGRTASFAVTLAIVILVDTTIQTKN